MKDFIINFCMDHGFQPKDLMDLRITSMTIEYSYFDDAKMITVKEAHDELFR